MRDDATERTFVDDKQKRKGSFMRTKLQRKLKANARNSDAAATTPLQLGNKRSIASHVIEQRWRSR